MSLDMHRIVTAQVKFGAQGSMETGQHGAKLTEGKGDLRVRGLHLNRITGRPSKSALALSNLLAVPCHPRQGKVFHTQGFNASQAALGCTTVSQVQQKNHVFFAAAIARFLPHGCPSHVLPSRAM